VGVPGTGVPGVPKESKRVRAQQLTESGGIIDNSPFSIFVKKGGI